MTDTAVLIPRNRPDLVRKVVDMLIAEGKSFTVRQSAATVEITIIASVPL